MKHTLIILFSIIALVKINSQISGSIQYEETLNIHKQMGERAAQFKDVVPEFRTAYNVLYFDQGASLYKKDPNKEEVKPTRAPDRPGPRFRRGNSKREIYLDLTENKRLEARNLFDKEILIEDKPITYNWKLTKETMQVGDYLANKAIAEDSTETIIAWYTPQIPVPVGPSNFGGLPGMILHLDMNDGTRVITATSITIQELDPEILKAPSNGKKMTQEAFDKIREERIKEMRQMRGGPGGRRRG